MQSLFSPADVSPPWKHGITAAVLRDNNQVVCIVGETETRLKNEPANIRQIALGEFGLACCTKDSKLYRCKDIAIGLRLDESIGDVESTLTLTNGELCVVSKSQAFTCNSENQWIEQPELTDWFKPRRSSFKSTIKTRHVVALFALLISYFGISTYQSAQQRSLIIEELRRPARLRFEHELVAKRTTQPALEPGRPWLTSILGFNPFLRVEEANLGRRNNSSNLKKIGKLYELKHLNIFALPYKPLETPPDISAIENLTQLETLTLSGSFESLQPLVTLPHLQRLDLSNLHNPESHDLSLIGKMPQLVSLSLPYQQAAPRDVESLADLEHLSCKYSSRTLPNLFRRLEKLKSLNISCESDPNFEDLGSLRNLEELSVRGIRELKDLEWVTELTNLRKLTVLTRSEPLTAVRQAPLGKLKNLESLALPCGSRFDLELLNVLKRLTLDSISVALPLNRDETTTGRIHRSDRLCLNLTNATSIKPFRHLMHSINELDISGTSIDDLSCIREFPNIRYLRLADTEIGDLSPIGDLPRLYGLNVAGTEFDYEDLKLIRNPYLTSLNLARTSFSDISRLSEFAYLRNLNLSHTETADLTEIVRFPDLSELTLSGCPIRDISPLRFLSNLRTLKLDDTNVDDIQPLSEVTLTKLDLYGTPVVDPDRDQRFPQVSWNCELRRPDGTMRPKQQKE